MKRGESFTPDGPLTLGDIREIAKADGLDEQVVEIYTPMNGTDRRRVTITVTNVIWRPPPAEPEQSTEPSTTAAERI